MSLRIRRLLSFPTSFSNITLAAMVIVIALLASLYAFVRSSKIKGAVAANGYECSEIGGKILEKGGSAVDAAIATALCEGIAMPSACGIGGGFLMTIYTKSKGVEFLDAREVAPYNAHKDMFTDSSMSQRGPLSVAVPGEIRGYYKAHLKYGRLKWKTLFQPVIDLCFNGVYVTKFLAKTLAENVATIKKDPGLTSMFIDNSTGCPYKEGDTIKYPTLGETLKIIAKEPDALYSGRLAGNFVMDINGIITLEDLKDYTPRWSKPISTKLPSGETLYTSPPPAGGLLLVFIMKVLNGFIDKNEKSIKTWHRIIETFKHAFGIRTKLGDDPEVMMNLYKNVTSPEYIEEVRAKIFPDKTCQDPLYYGANVYNPYDEGTAHISVLAPNGDAVSITTTINYIFGAGYVSESTGIILNDEMDDFSSPSIINTYNIPPSPSNFIIPGRRPISSMCPSIILDENKEVRMVVGAAGGPKITTSVTLLILRTLWFGMHIQDAIDKHRLHHQLIPMVLQLEDDYSKRDKILVDSLNKIGHKIEYKIPQGFSAVTAIFNDNGNIYAIHDPRRPGSTYYVS